MSFVVRGAVVLCVCALVGVGGVADGASILPRGPAREVIKDCTRRSHHSALTRAYPQSSLKAAYRLLVRRAIQVEPCGDAIASQEALAGPSGSARAGSVVRDCLDHARLTRAYRRSTLRRAYASLTFAEKTETQCAVSVASQLNALRVPGSAAVLPPIERRAPPANPSEAMLLQKLAGMSAGFARPRAYSDDLSPVLLGDVDRTNQQAGRVLADPGQSRKIGPAGSFMYAIPGDQRMCVGIEVSDQAATLGCRPSGYAADFDAGLVVAPGGLRLWGFVPRGVSAIRVLTHAGDWRGVPVSNDGIDYPVGPRDPRLVTWRDPAGTTRYEDLTTIPCLGGQPCPATATQTRLGASGTRQ